jgi:hypothetical protein
MPKKKNKEIEADYKKFIEERQQALIQNPEQYLRDFAATIRKFIICHYPDLDPDDQESREALKENFIGSGESLILASHYNLGVPWDPTGEEPPVPAVMPACREIRCQETPISLNDLRKGQINLGRQKVSGRYLILEVDLDNPQSLIKDCILRLVTYRKKKIKIFGPHREVVKVAEPRDADGRFVFPKMQVWKMVEGDRKDAAEPESKILRRLAEKQCREDGWDKNYDDFKDDPDYEERLNIKYNALKNAYLRDKKLYFGE